MTGRATLLDDKRACGHISLNSSSAIVQNRAHPPPLQAPGKTRHEDGSRRTDNAVGLLKLSALAKVTRTAQPVCSSCATSLAHPFSGIASRAIRRAGERRY